ncbi:spore germination protein KC [Bacillus sp. OV322]|uniref:Ger(x)C family spore germination protein n=1 Tax=Bacillus sp. OV322 TaxID=1882764 RepID=UPI0008F0F5D3|nr:Ger(x)C family spore germination protein [Bacillus sp. OV322]SFC96294.1 spore germination protein KC [Bacillus sp. OV322]
MIRVIIAVSMFALLLGGCSSYSELNKTAVIVGLGIDYDSKKNLYEVTFQAINPTEKSTSASAGRALPVVVFSSKGKTISEAARKSTERFSRENDYSHIAIIMIGEELARKAGINYLFDVFERDGRIRVNVPLMIAKKEKAKNVMNILPSIEDPAASLESKLKNSAQLLGETSYTKIYQVIAALESNGEEPVISGIGISGNVEQGLTKKNYEKLFYTHTQLNGLGMFKKGKLIGWIEGNKAKSVQIIKNTIKGSNLSLYCSKKNYTSLQLRYSKSKAKVIMRDNKPIITVNVKAIGVIDESLCNRNISSLSGIKSFEKEASSNYGKLIREGIDYAQDYKCDVFGFGEMLRKSNLKEWQKVQGKWEKTFPKAEVQVTVDFKIEGTGMRVQPYPF